MCIISVETDAIEFVMTVAKKKDGVKSKLGADIFAQAVEQTLSDSESFWPIEVALVSNPRMFGKKPKDL